MKLIDKDALVAEIEKRIKTLDEILSRRPISWPTLEKLIEENKKVLSVLNTLEVKEVDLEKEAELIANGIMIGVQANRYNTVVYNTKRNDFNHSHLMLAARKGIELGLKIHKNEI